MAKALETPLTDLSFDDREIILSQGLLPVVNPSSLLHFNQLVCRLGLRSGVRDKQLEEQVKKARCLQGNRLGLEELARFLKLPVSDTLTQVYNLFEQSEYGQMDIRHYITALSTVLRPSKSLETLKLAFEVRSLPVTLVNLDKGKITYDELHHLLKNNSYFSRDCLDFKDHPREFCMSRPKSCNGQSHDKEK
uniref:Lysophosphatidylcholine acyltransferase 1 n=1 Tax=Iconisemion striatum TaxID=60296 RepID=A0A1A7WH49_9TELE